MAVAVPEEGGDAVAVAVPEEGGDAMAVVELVAPDAITGVTGKSWCRLTDERQSVCTVRR